MIVLLVIENREIFLICVRAYTDIDSATLQAHTGPVLHHKCRNALVTQHEKTLLYILATRVNY